MKWQFWNYNDLFNPPIGKQNQLTLGEGSTLLYPIDDFLSNQAKFSFTRNFTRRVFFKTEFSNPTGTHKDRSFAYWISYLKQTKVKRAVISSSGNSAISAARYCALTGIALDIFISPAMPVWKRKNLEKVLKIQNSTRSSDRLSYRMVGAKFKIQNSLTPKRDAFRFAKDTGAYFLRSSVDDKAIEGYKTIAFELAKQMPDIDAIVIPTSSGTTAKGIYEGFRQCSEVLKVESPLEVQLPKIGRIPSFFIVQTAAVHPIVKKIYENEHSDIGCHSIEKKSLATSIVDKIAHRKNEIVDIVKKTGGGGVIVSNDELKKTKSLLSKKGQTVGWESIVAIAALAKIPNEEYKNIVCLCTS